MLPIGCADFLITGLQVCVTYGSRLRIILSLFGIMRTSIQLAAAWKYGERNGLKSQHKQHATVRMMLPDIPSFIRSSNMIQ